MTIIPETAWSATTVRALKRALVNIIRVRQGTIVLESRLDANLLDSFQDYVKLMVADTDLRNNAKVVCEGMAELGLDSRLRDAEYRAERVVTFISQIVEYDG